MTKRIFRSICLVAMAVFLASLVLVMGVLYGYFSDVQQSQLKIQTMLAAQGVSNEGINYLEGLDTEYYRITWIDKAGKVLYDSKSDMSEMENHLEREEMKEALLQGYGESRRYSTTLMERSLYCAKLLEDGTVLRLSAAQYTVITLMLGMAQPICMVFAIAVALSVLLAVRLSREIVKPLNALDLDAPLSNQEYDELSPLLKRIDSQQKQLKWQKTQLQHRQQELDAVVGNIREGMVLLNGKGRILSINPAAENLLNAAGDCIGKDILTVSRNLDLQEILAKVLNGERAAQTIRLHGWYYQINASPIVSGTSVSGAAILLFDVTEREKAEQMRREFTANVSHELKTPLHSISGYAELLQNGMAVQEDIVPFAGKIYAEAQRLVRLVEDIISLSHLDEGAGSMKREETKLYALAQAAVQSLEPEAKAAGVALELAGVPAVINGIPHLLYSMIYNLCDNAIKYNRSGGKAVVEIKAKGVEKQNQAKEMEEQTAEGAADAVEVQLLVSDTGIGIAPEHQERIFERFYRVDKSHSKEIGGTGLGLSIVKHAAKIHNAKIELHSVVGEGTVIAVKFYNKRIK